MNGYLSLALASPQHAAADEIIAQGKYHYHLQGIAGNGKDALYWCFTDKLVKTDANGKLLAGVSVKSHHGDLCVSGDRVYVAYCSGWGKPNVDSKIFVYGAAPGPVWTPTSKLGRV